MEPPTVNADQPTLAALAAGVSAQASDAAESAVLSPTDQAQLLAGVIRFGQLGGTATEYEYTIKQILQVLAELLTLDLAALVSYDEATCYGLVHQAAPAAVAHSLNERFERFMADAEDTRPTSLHASVLWNRKLLDAQADDRGHWITVPTSDGAQVRGAFLFHVPSDTQPARALIEALCLCADHALSLPHLLRANQDLAREMGHRYHAVKEMVTLFRQIDNPDFALEYLLILMECTKVERGAIWAINPKSKEERLWSIGLSTEYARLLSVDGIHPILASAAAAGKSQTFESAVLLADPVDTLTDLPEGVQPVACRSLTVLPLIAAEGIVGAVALFDAKLEEVGGARFTDMMSNLAATFLEAQYRHERLLNARELELQVAIARDIQQSLLPSKVPTLAGYEVAATSIPAKELGGDFYHIVRTGKRLAMTIGDVSGKGVPAGVLMTASRIAFDIFARLDFDFSAAMAIINNAICDGTPSDRFVTAFHTILDPATHTLHCWNAGHDPLIVFRAATGTLERVDPDGMILGIEENIAYETKGLVLEPGDHVFMYTDGLPEARNHEGTEFGFPRLEQLLREHGRVSAHQLVNMFTSEVLDFAKDCPRHDDLTLIALRRLPETPSTTLQGDERS